MNKLFCILFLIGTLYQGISQNRSFGTLSMIQSPTVKLKKNTTNNSNVDELKLQHATEIFDRLVEARGDFRSPVPTLVMNKKEDYGAYMDYEKMEINLEEKAYDVCAKFRDSAKVNAALAFILGHELTHHYEKHAWRRGFVTNFKNLDIGMKLDSIQDDVVNETQADYLGGFLCYTAGFGYFENAGALVDSIYKAYKLPNKLAKYPSLADRKKLCTRTFDKLQDLIQIFNMANLLTLTEHFEMSHEFSKFVLQDYQSREIYNNFGVSILLQAIIDFPQYAKKRLKYKYPIEIELQERWPINEPPQNNQTTGGWGSSKPKLIAYNPFQKLVYQALLNFDAAISLDPNFAPAYLNKACAYSLLGDSTRAAFYANVECRLRAKQNYEKTTLDIDVLLGVLEANSGNDSIAKTIFQTAAEKGSSIAKLNLKVLVQGPKDFFNEDIKEPKIIISEPVEDDNSKGSGGATLMNHIEYTPAKDYGDDEQIDSLNLRNLITKSILPNMKTINIGDKTQLSTSTKKSNYSTLYIIEQVKSYDKIYFLGTKPKYKGKTFRGISIGSNVESVLKVYGDPKSTYESSTGQILTYHNIIFILGKKNQVEQWYIYEKA